MKEHKTLFEILFMYVLLVATVHKRPCKFRFIVNLSRSCSARDLSFGMTYNYVKDNY